MRSSDWEKLLTHDEVFVFGEMFALDAFLNQSHLSNSGGPFHYASYLYIVCHPWVQPRGVFLLLCEPVCPPLSVSRRVVVAPPTRL